MSRETTNAGKLGRLQGFAAALAANSADLQHLEGSRTQFAVLLIGFSRAMYRYLARWKLPSAQRSLHRRNVGFSGAMDGYLARRKLTSRRWKLPSAGRSLPRHEVAFSGAMYRYLARRKLTSR